MTFSASSNPVCVLGGGRTQGEREPKRFKAQTPPPPKKSHPWLFSRSGKSALSRERRGSPRETPSPKGKAITVQRIAVLFIHWDRQIACVPLSHSELFKERNYLFEPPLTGLPKQTSTNGGRERDLMGKNANTVRTRRKTKQATRRGGGEREAGGRRGSGVKGADQGLGERLRSAPLPSAGQAERRKEASSGVSLPEARGTCSSG